MKAPKNIMPRNVGVDWTRTERKSHQINLEKIFMEEWDEENRDIPWINSGLGIAQELMIISEKDAEFCDAPNQDREDLFNLSDGRQVCIYNLTEREQRIIATIIQWLGTNVGFSFLWRCLKRANYSIQEIHTKKEPVSEPPQTKKGRFRILGLT